jgi:hypothetical protein
MVSRRPAGRPLTVEARTPSKIIPCGIYGGQFGTGTSFYPNISVFPSYLRSATASYLFLYKISGVRGNFFRGEGQQIHLRREGRENGDLGALAP